jgi:putative ABC transport system permease protein
VKGLRAWFARVAGLFGRERRDRELAQELASHLDLHAEDNVRAGMSRQEARRQALIKLGGVEATKELYRERRGLPFVETLWQDLRFAARTLGKDISFTMAASLTLALGIGASTAVFTLVNGVLLKPLPYPHAERIVYPWRQSPPGVELGFNELPWGIIDTNFFLREAHTFESLAAFKNGSFNLTGWGEPALLEGHRVSAAFFSALGIYPERGRAFTKEEDQAGHEFEVILSYALWRDKFGGKPDILGASIELNGQLYSVVGVMPAGFDFPQSEEMPSSFNFPRKAQIWVPLALSAKPYPAQPADLAIIGRLNPGASVQQAQTEMDLLGRQVEKQFPNGKGWFSSKVTPMALQVTGDTKKPLLLILGAVGVLLLIASSNVAALLLARSMGRKREFTMRAALGASHGRLLRQALTESLLLAAIGGAAGLALADASVRFIKIIGSDMLPRMQEVGLDLRVFGFALAVTAATGILSGLAPALGAAGTDLAKTLKEDDQRSGGSRTGQRYRKLLLVGQVAMAMVLLVAAGLLTRTFFQLLKADPGFQPARVLTFTISLPAGKYTSNEKIVDIYDRILARLGSLPGVQAAGIAETAPMGGIGESTVVKILDRPPVPDLQAPYANYTIASPNYFRAAGTPLLRGRYLQESDRPESVPVTIINNAMARKYWPNEDSLGKMLGLGSPRFPPMKVVGIVADMKHQSLREQVMPEMYVMYTQKPYPSMLTMQAIVRTHGEPAAALGSIRTAMAAVDADLPVAKVSTLQTIVDQSMTRPRFAMLLLGGFGALALALASIGMYGVIAHSVSQRTREIGVRMALGAAPGQVSGMMLKQGARLAGLGIAIGVGTALGVTQLLKAYLYQVKSTDPATFVGVAALLVSVALLACWIPARRAMRVDPMVALRHE